MLLSNMRYYFFRHGESEANRENLFTYKKINPHLTEKGVEQARKMGEFVKDIPIQKVFVSPLIRAQETAGLIFPGRELLTEENLIETNVGILDGKNHKDPVNWKIYKDVVDAWEAGDNTARVEGGESNDEIKARLIKMLYRVNSECTESAALVAHSDVLRSFFFLFCQNHGKHMQDNYMDKGRMTIVTRDAGVYMIEKFNLQP